MTDGMDAALTAGYVDIPARLELRAEPEGLFPMRHEDWQRIRERLADCRPPSQSFANLGWAVLGIAVGAALALMTWLPARSGLPAAEWAWVTPALSAVAVAGAFMAAMCFFAQRGMNRSAGETVESVLADMDRVYTPHAPDRLRAVK